MDSWGPWTALSGLWVLKVIGSRLLLKQTAELWLEAGSPGPRAVPSPATLVPMPPFHRKMLRLGHRLSTSFKVRASGLGQCITRGARRVRQTIPSAHSVLRAVLQKAGKGAGGAQTAVSSWHWLGATGALWTCSCRHHHRPAAGVLALHPQGRARPTGSWLKPQLRKLDGANLRKKHGVLTTRTENQLRVGRPGLPPGAPV